MPDSVPEQRYAAYPRPNDGAVERLRALGQALYTCAWVPGALLVFVWQYLVLQRIGYFYLGIGIFSLLSFVMTYRAFVKLAFAKNWSRTSPLVAAIIAGLNDALLLITRVHIQSSDRAYLAFLAIGTLLLFVPMWIIKREVRSFGMTITLIGPDVFYQALAQRAATESTPPFRCSSEPPSWKRLSS